MTKVTAHLQQRRALMRTRAQAGFDLLKKNAEGRCVQGSRHRLTASAERWRYELAGTARRRSETRRGARLVPKFSPGGGSGEGNIKGRVSSATAAEDEVAPLPEVNKLVRGLTARRGELGAEWSIAGAQQWLTNPTNAAEERADREYKVSIQRFFKEIYREMRVSALQRT